MKICYNIMVQKPNVKSKLIYIVLIVVSFISVLFNTSMSPLYDASYITHDASVFYVIGRGMKEGLLPYKDLFDHKGIYIYFLYYIAVLIGEQKLLGLYIVFSVLASIFSIFSYKTLGIFSKNKVSSFFTAILSLNIAISVFFSNGVLLCEFVSLVTISISIYIVINDIFVKETFDPKDMMWHGILCAINIFSKTNYALFYFSLAIFVLISLIFIKKDIKILFLNMFFGLCGLVIGILPVIIYCTINGIVSDMFFAVFTFNFNYIGDLSVDLPKGISTKTDAFIHCIEMYYSTYLIILSSIAILFVQKIIAKKEDAILSGKYFTLIVFYIATLIFANVSILMPLTSYSYYLTLLVPYMMPLIFSLFNYFFNIFKEKKVLTFISIIISMIFISLFSYSIGGNYLKTQFFVTSREHKKIMKEISKYIRLNKKSKVLCFGLGTNIYNTLGVIPNEKYFYLPSITYDNFKLPVDSLLENIKSYKNDVIFYMVNKKVVGNKGYEAEEFLDDNYIKIIESNNYGKVYIKKELYDKPDEDEQ